MRFDVYLTANGYFESRNKAAAAIKEGLYSINGKIVTKPSFDVNETDRVEIIKQTKTYVARSAQKLLTAFKLFSLNWTNKVAVDLGASTGGFCQVLLENGVCNVFAVDIGTAQLHPSIKSDPRIVNMEHTNARYLQASDFPLHIDVATADLSFISIKAVLPAIKAVLGEQGEAIILVKPQFEAGPENLSKSGVVLNLKVHISVLKEVTDFAQNCGFGVAGIAFSGLAGESGNREYLLYLNIGQTIKIDIPTAIKEAVYSEDNHE